jgi:hypothetical protein
MPAKVSEAKFISEALTRGVGCGPRLERASKPFVERMWLSGNYFLRRLTPISKSLPSGRDIFL